MYNRSVKNISTAGWKVAENLEIIPVDLEAHPLQIKTEVDVVKNNKTHVDIVMFKRDEDRVGYWVVGEIVIRFGVPLKLRVRGCNDTTLSLQAKNSPEIILTVTKRKTKMTIDYDGKRISDVDYEDCSEYGLNVTHIMAFYGNFSYREYEKQGKCMGISFYRD